MGGVSEHETEKAWKRVHQYYYRVMLITQLHPILTNENVEYVLLLLHHTRGTWTRGAWARQGKQPHPLLVMKINYESHYRSMNLITTTSWVNQYLELKLAWRPRPLGVWFQYVYLSMVWGPDTIFSRWHLTMHPGVIHWGAWQACTLKHVCIRKFFYDNNNNY